MPLPDFHPAVAGWFSDRFGTPTPVQAGAWPAIHAGRPSRESRLTPTRPACASPASVTTGTPIQSASHVVVLCARIDMDEAAQ